MNTQNTTPTDAEREQALAEEQTRWDRKIQMFERQLDDAEYRTREAAEAFTEAVAKHGVVYAIEWGESYARTIQKGELWVAVARFYDTAKADGEVAAARAALNAVLEQVTKELLNNWVIRNSTGAFARAASHTKAEAFASFVPEAQALLQHLSER